MCYEVARIAFPGPTGISLDDVFGPGTINIVRPKRLCNPANKNGEDPTAVGDVDHLLGYIITQTAPKFVPVSGVTVANQFGTVTMQVARPEVMLVPTAKSLTGPPGPLAGPPTLDHFKCYRVRNTKTRVNGIVVDDQFGTLMIDITRPFRLCVAADKNMEGIVDPTASLMCYKARISPGFPPFRGPDGPVWVEDQFGPQQLTVDHQRELCVPSTVTP